MNHLAQQNAMLLAGAAAPGSGYFLPGGGGGGGAEVVRAAQLIVTRQAAANQAAQQAANQAVVTAANQPAAGTPVNQGGGCGGLTDEALAKIAWFMKGGTQADGSVCAPHENPPIPRNLDGCLAGKIQCKQPLAVTSLAVGIGLSVTITVTPRSMAVARQMFYGGTAGAFTIDSVTVNGRDYLNGAILADRYGGIVDDLSVDWGEGFSSTTPLFMVVTNISGAIDDFRGVIDSSIDY